MTTLSQLTSEVQRLCRRTDSTFQPIVQDAIRRKYREVLRHRDWPQLRLTETFTVPANSEYWGIPAQAAKIEAIFERGREYLFEPAGQYPVFIQPSASDVLNFQKATTDATVKLRIEGYLSGVGIDETTTFGLVSNNSLNSYDTVTAVERVDTSSGAVSIREGTTVIGRIPAGYKTWKYQWVRLGTVWDDAKELSVRHYRHVPPLDADSDVIALDCADILVAGANAECHRALREYQDAEREEYRFRMLLQDFSMEADGQGEHGYITPIARYR